MLGNTADMKASPEQIRCIWGLGRKNGLDKDALHDKCLAVTGQAHISQLTKYQAIRLIDSLMGKKPRDFYPVEYERPEGEQSGPDAWTGWPGQAEHRASGAQHGAERPISRASQEQIRLILGLAKKLGWVKKRDGEAEVDKDRLNGFIRSQYGVDHIDWMEPDAARNCIEAMKAMLAGGRKERKGYRGDA